MIEIKEHTKVKYLGRILDESFPGESMALRVIDKVNSRLRLLHRHNHFLAPPLRRLLHNALIQGPFGYVCTKNEAFHQGFLLFLCSDVCVAWFPNFSKRL